MTDSATTPAAAEPKAKRTYDRTPWHIYTVTEDGCANLKAQGVGPFKDLREAETECARLAASQIGITFAPVKVGTTFKANKVERVEVKRA